MTFVEVGRAIGVNPRTVARWEFGQSIPKEPIWVRLLTLYGARAPQAAQALAAAVGRPMPAIRTPATVDRALAERVVARAADALDVAPRRVREVLLAAARAAIDAGMGFEGLLGSVVAEAGASPATHAGTDPGQLRSPPHN